MGVGLVRRLALMFILAFSTSVASAAVPQQDSFSWKLNDDAAPANPSRATKDGFGAFMMVTGDYEGFWKAWEGPTPPQLTTTDIVTREKPVHAMIIFSGCRAGAEGNCNVTAEFSISGPDGAPYGDVMQGSLWQGPSMPDYNLQLGEGSIGFILEPEDPFGTYTLKAAITDQVAGITLQVEQAVTAAESAD